jgi:hypothetical protein
MPLTYQATSRSTMASSCFCCGLGRSGRNFGLASGMAGKNERHQNELRVGLCSDLGTNRIVVDPRAAEYAGTSGIVGHQKILSRTFLSRTAQILSNCRDDSAEEWVDEACFVEFYLPPVERPASSSLDVTRDPA